MLAFDSEDILYEETIQRINDAQAGDTVYIFQTPKYRIVEYATKHDIIIPEIEQIPNFIARPKFEGNVCVILPEKRGKEKGTYTVIIGDRICSHWIPKYSVVDLMFAITYDKGQGNISLNLFY